MSGYDIVKAWRAKNKEKVNAQARRYRKRHPENIAAIRKRYRERHGERVRPIEAARARARRKADPEGQRRRTKAYKARQEAKLVAIAGRERPAVCDICGEVHIRIVFDHCHVTGKFRGWLCDRCNRVLGIVKDDPGLLLAMRGYLLGVQHGQTYKRQTKQIANEQFRFAWTSCLPDA